MLIDEQGKSLDVVSRDQALILAYEKGLDLVEVGPASKPPVARIVDYGKYQYTKQKKQQKAKAHQKESLLKEVKLGYKTDHHDFQTKAKKAREFLAQGHKVRIFMVLRGREKAYGSEAAAKVVEFGQAAGGRFDFLPRRLGGTIAGILVKQ